MFRRLSGSSQHTKFRNCMNKALWLFRWCSGPDQNLGLIDVWLRFEIRHLHDRGARMQLLISRKSNLGNGWCAFSLPFRLHAKKLHQHHSMSRASRGKFYTVLRSTSCFLLWTCVSGLRAVFRVFFPAGELFFHNTVTSKQCPKPGVWQCMTAVPKWP